MNSDQPLDPGTRLLSNLLDSLDDLDDQRERAAWWLERLMAATAEALGGTTWEPVLRHSSASLTNMIRTVPEKDWNERALQITGDIRLMLANDDAIASGGVNGQEQFLCRRCNRPVVKSQSQYEVFEEMHYVCFHYEFEHEPTDPDEECRGGGCPSRSV
jgi:hypothetical protein